MSSVVTEDVEVSFRVKMLGDEEDRRWVTAEVGQNGPVVIGYARPHGEGVAVHGSGEGWPMITVCADDLRALCSIIGTWAAQIASLPDLDDE